jgi:hypothetical protein
LQAVAAYSVDVAGRCRGSRSFALRQLANEQAQVKQLRHRTRDTNAVARMDRTN